jgi:hypothetical protein
VSSLEDTLIQAATPGGVKDELPNTFDTTRTRRCSAIKRNGERCMAWALHGRDLCSGHSGIVKLDPVKAARASAEARRRRADIRRESLRDRLARKAEENAEKIWQAYLRGIESEDPGVAFRAAEALVQRIYGKPTEHVKTETVPTGLDPEDLAKLPREERRRVMASYARRTPT